MAHHVKNSEDFGIEIEGNIKINFPKIMERMRRIRAGISKADSAERFAKYGGVDVFLGHA